MSEPFTPSEKIEWVESGIRLALTDTFLRNVEIRTERDSAIRAVVSQVISGFYRHFTGVHPELSGAEEVPVSLWQHIKMKLPFLKGKTRTIYTTYYNYNLCPHLLRRGDEIHLEFLQGRGWQQKERASER